LALILKINIWRFFGPATVLATFSLNLGDFFNPADAALQQIKKFEREKQRWRPL
jgi:hypothetical protein